MDSACPRPGCGGKLVLYYSRRTSGFTQKCFRCGGAWRGDGFARPVTIAASPSPLGAAAR